MSQDNMDYTGDTMGDMGPMSDMSTTGLTASPTGEGLIAKLQTAVGLLNEIIDLLGGSPEEASPDLNADDLNLDEESAPEEDTTPEPYSDFGDEGDATKKYQSLKSLVESIRA